VWKKEEGVLNFIAAINHCDKKTIIQTEVVGLLVFLNCQA
jgi:hypothetical protein